jgi:hypothetical protein
VFYSRGYRFDLRRGVFVHSGTITIKSNPQSNIEVSLNDTPSDSKTLNRINNSFNIAGLLPDNYDIKVTAPGFQIWDKKAAVHSGLASEFWNILLVRNNYEKIALPDTRGASSFFMSPKNKFIAYILDNDQSLGVRILNISNKKTDQNFDIAGWRFGDRSGDENVEWSPEEDYLSVPVQKKTEVLPTKDQNNSKIDPTLNAQKLPDTTFAYYIIDPQSNTPTNLNDFLGKKDIRHVRWDPQNKGYLFFLEGSDLFSASVLDKGKITKISSDVSTFDLSRNNIYFVKSPNNLVFRSDLEAATQSLQITNRNPDTTNEVIEKIIMYDETRIALVTDKKNFFIYNEGEHGTYFRKLGSNVLGLHFSDDGKKVLFWTNNELFLYMLRDWKVAPIRQENDLTSVTRYSEPIKNVEWSKDYEHVIFSTGRWVKVIELDPRDHRNCMDILNTQTENPFVRYNSFLEYLYFTDKSGDATQLNYIAFPEPTPLLGIGGY